MRQPKREHDCPNCGGPLKRTIGAQTRIKFWECVNKGPLCYKRKAS